MKKNLKNILENVVSIVAVAAIFLGTAEASTSNGQLLWTGSCLVVGALCAVIFNHLTKEEEV